MGENTEADLLALVAQGDTEAFQSLVEMYQGRIIAFLHHFLHDYNRALDLAQEAFLRLYRHFRQLAPAMAKEENCKSLLFTIAANLGKDELRHRAVRKETSLEAGAMHKPGNEATPLETLAGRETADMVRQTLAALPAETRSLLLLRDVEGLSYEEIASVTGAGLGTVKSRINRARLAFKCEYTRRLKSAGEMEK